MGSSGGWSGGSHGSKAMGSYKWRERTRELMGYEKRSAAMGELYRYAQANFKIRDDPMVYEDVFDRIFKKFYRGGR